MIKLKNKTKPKSNLSSGVLQPEIIAKKKEKIQVSRLLLSSRETTAAFRTLSAAAALHHFAALKSPPRDRYILRRNPVPPRSVS